MKKYDTNNMMVLKKPTRIGEIFVKTVSRGIKPLLVLLV